MNGNLSRRVARLESEIPGDRGMLHVFEGAEDVTLASLGITEGPNDLVIHVLTFAGDDQPPKLLHSKPL